MKHILPIFLLLLPGVMRCQTIPAERRVDWTLAGLRDTTTSGFHYVDVRASGLSSDGLTANDEALERLLSTPYHPGVVFVFPEGEYLFRKTIHLRSNQVLRGSGAEHTRIVSDLGGSGHSISIQGQRSTSDSSGLSAHGERGSNMLTLHDASFVSEGDWLHLTLFDQDLVTSVWAHGTVGQIVRVQAVEQHTLVLDSPLRMDFPLSRLPKATLLDMRSNAGIECLSMERRDNAAPQQASAIHFSYANNCRVFGIESYRCTFAHVVGEYSSNLSVSASWLHHAFEYGGGGRAYGVVWHLTTNECRAEDNIFEHLRHSMLLQAGANGNVFAYNYSIDPFWSDSNPLLPSNSAGDMVLHGNYVFANLFEHNMCQNIVVDNSHGPNGPYNTLFRNRAMLYGIFFSAENSPGQNIVGNEVPNTQLPYRLVNYVLRGGDHFVFGNNNKGSIEPPGTDDLPDTSYAYAAKPGFIGNDPWVSIGTPHQSGAGDIPAARRYRNNEKFSFPCGTTQPLSTTPLPESSRLILYPNPVKNTLMISGLSPLMEGEYVVTDVLGRARKSGRFAHSDFVVDVSGLPSGVYILAIPPHTALLRMFLVR